MSSRHQHFTLGAQTLAAVCLCACWLSLDPRLSLSYPLLRALLLWVNTCCCLTHLRTTSSLSPASCNPRLDHFSRFEVNQLQIPLASYRVKITNRRLHMGAEVRCGSSRLACRYQLFLPASKEQRLQYGGRSKKGCSRAPLPLACPPRTPTDLCFPFPQERRRVGNSGSLYSGGCENVS